MTTYAVIRKSDQTEVYRYSADAPVEWNGWPWTEYDNVLVPDPIIEAPPTPVTVWEPALDFLRRFTPQERIGARVAAQTDPVMADFWDLLRMAPRVHSNDSDVQLGLGYMVQQGYLAPDRPAQILSGE